MGLSENESVKGHDAIRRELAARVFSEPKESSPWLYYSPSDGILSGLPSSIQVTDDPVMLNTIEELIHHSLAAGDFGYAVSLYAHGMGGHRFLAPLGMYERGERTCRRLIEASFDRPRSFLPLDLHLERGLFLKDLGRLSEAADQFQLVTNSQVASNAQRGISEVLFLSGRLVQSREMRMALANTQYWWSVCTNAYLRALSAYICCLTGSLRPRLLHCGCSASRRGVVEPNPECDFSRG